MVKRICLSVLVSLLFLTTTEVQAKEETESVEEGCFCDGHELTIKEKSEELLIKALIDEQNYLDDGEISKETYNLQIRAINVALDYLESLSEEESKTFYENILLINLDWLDSDLEDGKEIDEEFYNYLEEELKKLDNDKGDGDQPSPLL